VISFRSSQFKGVALRNEGEGVNRKDKKGGPPDSRQECRTLSRTESVGHAPTSYRLFSEFSRRRRIDRAHRSSAIDFCSSFSFGHPQRLTCRGCGSGSASTASLASETAATSKSARASGCLLRAVPSKSPISQISSSERSSLHSAEIFSVEGLGRNAPGFGIGGAFLKWLS
jgi:hypothetical protein